jgi:monoterpene epsilon-lactone hydrolase
MNMSEIIKIKVLKGLIRSLVKPIFGPPWPYFFQRAWLDFMAMINVKPKHTQTSIVDMCGVPAQKVVNGQHLTDSKKIILYLHGGAYCLGSTKTHGGLTAHLAMKCKADVFVPIYRLAPDHAFPCAIDDSVKCYQWLLAQGIKASNIIMAGDSAGAGLVMATALQIKDKNLSKPAGLILLSPWVDLTLANVTRVHDRIDPLLRWSNLKAASDVYLKGVNPTNPLASAIFADLLGLSPMLIQVGSEEILLGDARALYEQAKKCDVDVSFNIFQGGWHVFQLQAGILYMANEALDEISIFIDNVTELKEDLA